MLIYYAAVLYGTYRLVKQPAEDAMDWIFSQFDSTPPSEHELLCWKYDLDCPKARHYRPVGFRPPE